MRRVLIAGAAATAAALAVSVAVIAQSPGDPVAVEPADVQPYEVRAGDVSVNAIGERLCGVEHRATVGAQVFAMNRDLVATLNVGEVLQVPTTCPGGAPSTTAHPTVPPTDPTTTTVPASTTTSPPATTTTAPATTTTTTLPAATTSTGTPTTTVPPATTSTATATTTSTSPPTTSSGPQPDGSGDFLATFDTAADFYDRFDRQVHHRSDNIRAGVTWDGDHNMACEGPDTNRTVHGDHEEELFWWCAPGGDPAKGHVMTSMGNMGPYSIVSFSPRQSFTDVGRVCWDINLTDMHRKWFEVLVIPEATFQANGGRLDYVSPPIEDVDGEAGKMSAGMVLWQQELEGAPTLYVGRDLVYQDVYGFTVTDKAKRYRHCFYDNGDGTITLEQEQADGQVRRAVAPGSFPAGDARVIFKDHSYDPGKDGPPGTDHGTWHWDNILVDQG